MESFAPSRSSTNKGETKKRLRMESAKTSTPASGTDTAATQRCIWFLLALSFLLVASNIQASTNFVAIPFQNRVQDFDAPTYWKRPQTTSAKNNNDKKKKKKTVPTSAQTNRLDVEAEAAMDSTPQTSATAAMDASNHRQDDNALMPQTLAIYFPQYHKDSVNDRNWGENFTDWDSLRGTPSKNRLGGLIPRPLEPGTEEHHNNGTTTTASGQQRHPDDDDLPPHQGYYDLAQTAPRKAHGTLARKFGIDGFIYHHYWFYDETDPGPTLATPLENMLKDGHPDLPFLLNWCATRWVDAWMGKALFQKHATPPPRQPGRPRRRANPVTLQEQYFNATQDMIHEHYLWLKRFFEHPNYIRVDDQPALLLYYYDPQALPILESLRRFATEDGFKGLHLIVGRSSHPEELIDPYQSLDLETFKNLEWQLRKNRQRKDLVDPTRNANTVRSIHANANHTPNNGTTVVVPSLPQTWDYNPFNQSMTYPYPIKYVNQSFAVPAWCTAASRPPRALSHPTGTGGNNTSGGFSGETHPEVIGVITSFDNTPRREYGTANIYPDWGESPEESLGRFAESYGAALYYQKCCVAGTKRRRNPARRQPPQHGGGGDYFDDRFVAINAWNEWAEGMTIEPSTVYGYRWLETIAKVKSNIRARPCPVAATAKTGR